MPSTHIHCLCTSRCNLRCGHCLRGHPGAKRDLGAELWDRILREAQTIGFRTVGLSGGEPCLHPEFERLLEMTISRGFTFSVATNGTLPEPYLAAHRRYGRGLFTYAKVSLDGLREEHDQLRGEGSFDTTLASIRRFREQGMGVSVAFCPSTLNLRRFEEFLSFCSREQLCHVEVFHLITTPANQELCLGLGDLESVWKAIDRAEKDRGLKVVRGNLDQRPYNGGILFCADLHNPSLTVNPEGEAVFCCSTVLAGATVCALAENSVAAAYRKTLDVARRVVERRIADMQQQSVSLGFNSCDYCNRVLAGQVRAVEGWSNH